MNDHWFDAMNKRLLAGADRRTLLRAAGAAVALLVGGAPAADAGKKPNKTRRPRRTCSQGACAREFRTAKDRRHCEFVCRQCDGADPRQFCITEGDPNIPVKTAVCCGEGTECCGRQCCGGDPRYPDRKCCGGRCVNTDRDPRHCGQCGHACDPGQACVAGDCACRGDRAGGGCRPCPDGQTLCSGECVDTQTDPQACGGCGRSCPAAPGWRCCGGSCQNTLDKASHCGACDHACPTGTRCCDGVCKDLASDPENCGRCGRSCGAGGACCNGICFDPGAAACCHDFQPCPTDGRWVCCDPPLFCVSAASGACAA